MIWRAKTSTFSSPLLAVCRSTNYKQLNQLNQLKNHPHLLSIRSLTMSSNSSSSAKSSQPPSYKRIIVCCDGTWQKVDAPYKPKKKHSTAAGYIPESNVVRLGRSLKKTAQVNKDGKTYTVPQVVFYQNGIGSRYLSLLGSVFAGAVGGGLNSNVCEAYWFIANNWEEGDEIFLFGFSRGAYTARALSGLIATIGILRRHDLPKFQDIYEKYMKKHEDPKAWKSYFEDPKLELKANPENVTIKVIGVFDTVGSVGIPENKLIEWIGWNNKYKFHDTELSDRVENAFHALALDEKRYHFGPAIWYLQDENKRVKKVKKTPQHINVSEEANEAYKEANTTFKKVNMKQCWFPGYHIDVGGGSTTDPNCNDDNSDISFAWMVDQCSPFLEFEECVSNELGGNKDKPKDGSSAYAIRDLHDSNSGIYKLEYKRVRQPGQYKFQNKNKAQSGHSGKLLKHVHTNETIHPCVRIRMLKADLLKEEWKPSALAEFQLTPCEPGEGKDGDAKWKWIKNWTDRKGKEHTVVIYEENILSERKNLKAGGAASSSTSSPSSASASASGSSSPSYSAQMLKEADKQLFLDETRSSMITPIPRSGWGWIAWFRSWFYTDH